MRQLHWSSELPSPTLRLPFRHPLPNFTAGLRAGFFFIAGLATKDGSTNGPVSALRALLDSPGWLGHRPGMTKDLTPIIRHVLERAPQWVRRDLEAKDSAIRARAEDTLAAMISSALQDHGTEPDKV